MKIALIGASGEAGSRLLKELSDCGQAVTAITRDTSRIAELPGAVSVAGDLGHHDALRDTLSGHDVVISSVHFTQTDVPQLIEDVKAAGPQRYLVVGGAGS